MSRSGTGNRNLRSNLSFLLLFGSRLVTNAGDSLYYVGVMWLIYDLTGSSLYTGVAGFLIQIPRTIQFLLGPLVDRWNLKKILVSTQIAQAILIAVIPVVLVAGYPNVFAILSMVFVSALIDQLVSPAQDAAIPRVVASENLVRANSLMSFTTRGTESLFNAISGVLVSMLGVLVLFVVNTLSFLVAAALFLLIKSQHLVSNDDDDANDENEYLVQLKEGLSYMRGSVVLLVAFGAMGANLGAGAVMAVLPEYADQLGPPRIYGFLLAAISGGTLTGALIATVMENNKYGRVAVSSFLTSGMGIFLVGFLSDTWISILLLFASYIPIGIYGILLRSLIHSAVDDNIIGRVTSIMSTVTGVMLPVGSLIGGILADIYSPILVIYVFAAILLLLGCSYLLDSRVRTLPSVSDSTEERLGLSLDAVND